MTIETNTDVLMHVTLAARESNGIIVCQSTCTMFVFCGRPMKIKGECPVAQWYASEKNATQVAAKPAKSVDGRRSPIGENPWPLRIKRFLRDNREISLYDMADLLKVSYQTCWNWKRGKTYPRESHQHNILLLINDKQKGD